MTDDDLAAIVARADNDLSELQLEELVGRVRAHRGTGDLAGADALRAARILGASDVVADLPMAARLSLQAHTDGIDAAGPLHAGYADRLALYSGRPQPYGTVIVEHQGDVVQPPVDPAVTDAERAELGVPPRRELQAYAEQATRELAVERAGRPGDLPRGQRFARVWTNPDPADLRARMAAEGTTVWADGDILTFVTESSVPVAVTPVFPTPSGDAGDGLQVLSVRVERLDEAVITYTFTPLGGAAAMNFSRGSHDGRFRGPSAPPELASNDPLVGSTFDHAVESAALGEPRRVTVYRPPGHQPGEDTPVVYATDGNMFAPYARRLDAAIESGLAPRVVVVAAHSAPADQVRGNQRALEYLPGFDEGRFDAHQRFFVDELSAWAEAEIGVPADRGRRAVLGCSDGGGHALATGRMHPDRYGHIFAFSTGMPPEPTTTWDAECHPFVHLCAGTLEGAFHQATEAWAGYLHMMDAPHHFTERVAGHDLVQWAEELPVALARAWGQTPNRD
ncbi:MAG: esterase family protein [Actinomycetia bacterium]|nr:esterase family protein [Actinomycetes bacterium]